MNNLQIIKRYKSYIASSYKFITPEQIKELPKGKLFSSKKYDGLFCCLVLSPKEKKLLLPNGNSVPNASAINKELKKIKCDQEIILAGELYVRSKDKKRERCADVHSSLAKLNDSKMHFVAFDIVQSSLEDLDCYFKKIEHIKKLLRGQNYFHPIEITETDESKISSLFNNVVIEQQNEGLVIRNNKRIYKMKHNIDLDLVVLGFTLQEKDIVRSIALGIALPENQYLHVGSVGNLGSKEKRKELYNELSKLVCSSSYRLSSSDGSLYKFVSPKLIVSISIKDIQNEKHDGNPIMHMAFNMVNNLLNPIHLTPSVSILHAGLKEIRRDKKPIENDCGINQLERAGYFIKDMKTDPNKQISAMKPSVIIEKHLYVKSSKNGKAVKKFVILETKKVEFEYPKYLFYFLDLSEKRKTPIQRDVRPFNDIKLAKETLNLYIEKNIKKGWEKI